jgi:hypothetical protein
MGTGELGWEQPATTSRAIERITRMEWVMDVLVLEMGS